MTGNSCLNSGGKSPMFYSADKKWLSFFTLSGTDLCLTQLNQVHVCQNFMQLQKLIGTSLLKLSGF